jgi:hypothetical protein
MLAMLSMGTITGIGDIDPLRWPNHIGAPLRYMSVLHLAAMNLLFVTVPLSTQYVNFFDEHLLV